MLNYARQRVIEALKTPCTAVLATAGPAGVQAGEFPCEASGLDLYLLVPISSDHLLNLEENPAATLLSSRWEVKGLARVVLPSDAAPGLDILSGAGPRAGWLEWCALVRVSPRQVQIRREAGWGNLETIDILS